MRPDPQDDGDTRERKERERIARRDSFLDDASDYHAARPPYPDALLQEAVELAELSAPARIFEIGCGTGEATQWFAHQGFRVRATDRSAEMLHFALQRLTRLENVEVIQADFEAAPPGESFDALLAATSYHWLNPDTRVQACADALRPDGALILLWHTHPLPYTGYFERAQEIYHRHVPDWTPPSTPGMAEKGILQIIEELTRDTLFTTPQRRSHTWTRTLDRALYLRLLNTYSDHRLLPQEQRTPLYAELAELIDLEFGGQVVRPYRTELVVARKA